MEGETSRMTECNRKRAKESSQLLLHLRGVKEVRVDFAGGEMTSDAGLVMLRGVDEEIRFTQRVNALLTDPRDPEKVEHEQETFLRQRV